MSNLYQNLLTAVATFLIASLLTLVAARLLRLAMSRITSRTKSGTDDYIAEVIIKTIKPLGLLISASVAWSILPIEEGINIAFTGIVKLLSLLLIVRLINNISLRLINSWASRIEDSSVSQMLLSLSPMIRALFWCLGAVIYLQNMGVQMAAIWALLSAGGIGAGLAIKEPVQEFFEYITILLDKPFENGQFIHIDDIWATVERVGVRSTRLRSLNGEIIIMSNSSLTNGIIANYGEMNSRRLVHNIGIIYGTKAEKVKKIPEMIKSIIDSTQDAIFDRCHFVEFGDFSLNFELVYYIPTNNYLVAMEAQQSINLGIMQKFEKENIEFAFPTQTLHMSKDT